MLKEPKFLFKLIVFFVIASALFFGLYYFIDIGLFYVLFIISIILTAIAFLVWIFTLLFANKPKDFQNNTMNYPQNNNQNYNQNVGANYNQNYNPNYDPNNNQYDN